MKWYQHIFGDVDARAKYSEAKRRAKEDKKLAKDPYALKSLSTEEIVARIQKLKVEETYREMLKDEEKEIKEGEHYFRNLFKSAFSKYVEGYASEAGKKAAGRKADKKKKKSDFYNDIDDKERREKQAKKEHDEAINDEIKRRKKTAKEMGKEAKKELTEGIKDYFNFKELWSDSLRD